MRIIGEKAKPRGLIWGFDDQTAGRLESLFPTSRRIRHPATVRQAEWDVIVTDGSVIGVENHLHAIGFGSSEFGSTVLDRGGHSVWCEVSFTGNTIATEFQIGYGIRPPILQLVERQLIPLAQSRPQNPVLTFKGAFSSEPGGSPPSLGRIVTFLETTEPKTLAGFFTRPKTGAEIWCLPPGLSDPVPWVSAALSIWHAQDPKRFPVDPLWRDNRDWLTNEELKVVDSLSELMELKSRTLAEFETQAEELQAELEVVRKEADESLRVLLTGAGDELVRVVQNAFEGLGFSVSNRDEVNPPQDRREDLWVTSPGDDPEWIAIVEVRGYAKGAAQGDLLRLSGRFSKRFMQEQQREPTRMWYLVNQFTGSDPSSRPRVLGTNPGEVNAFADEGGLVMDTASLFELVKRVQAPELSADDARIQLMAATGRWPPDDG